MNANVPHDAALPHLARAVDGAAMAPVFAAALDGLQVLACEVDRVKYRPARDCSVSYRLQLLDRQRGPFEQRVSARFCSGGGAAHRHAKAQQRTWVRSPAGPSLQHWPPLDMMAVWAPNDAKLDAFRLLTDDAELRRRSLDSVVVALGGEQARLIDHQCTLMQGVPELRACARVTMRLRATSGAECTTHTVYAKADRERSGAMVHAAMLALHATAAQRQGRLHTAQPLLWQPDTGLHWQCNLPGEPLGTPVGVEASAGVGEQLAALHDTSVPHVPMMDVARLRAMLPIACTMLGTVETAWQPALARLGARLDACVAALGSEPGATLHGDLHPGNVLVDAAGQLGFVDFDSMQRGPAVFELGAWIAYLLGRAVLDDMPSRTAGPAAHAFLGAYAKASGRRIDPARLAWSTAHHLLCRRACGGLATLKPGRYAAVPALLALAEAVLQAGTVDVVLDPPAGMP